MTTALAITCTLKPSPASSSSDLIARHLLDALAEQGVTGDVIRAVDHDIRPGVERDMGDGDEWPSILERIQAADILVITTPTWLGHMSSVAQRVLERLDAEVSETDGHGRPAMLGKVAMCGVVGNEDGAHKIIADMFGALDDIGFTIAGQGSTYWNDEAMGSRDYKDLDEVPEPVDKTTQAAARNAAHLARVLSDNMFPAYE
ncbi:MULTISPECIES: flavodoxin family protein [Gordonia]|uniref:NAD(P)H-dependent oxidoreductase n=1 Tax=Gordonia amicalis TaxID=89053 RepID=A0AAE4R464_9ACTN|nr:MULTISPECIES: NAD(P)H-dependent oxidoreductase [Gordonia]MCR8899769.1 NAD(P)H-dependent oxidoreductase [Gordonia sp. GONU]MCZ4578442.1 NAD(P)H-dependent oxidoreductase [Gordonia amicalis]MCZ4650838.1 NAD(P)H-dependent oxidoreductase [Gordonia amicalis]MDJ0452914.1 NAD(P)H-dependent oxidoreductase [Gordonia amicalis]MDV6307105.1 NAD(P)H-dependent oxidoreductase [Gordonia amicalis]